jgi:hypothetical protein
MSQTTLAPYPRFRASGATGAPLAGGKLYTLQPGTSGLGYLKATYTDSTGETANTNPVVLDANGEADVWLSGYTKLVLYDADDVLVWSVDNVSSMAATTLTQSQWVVQGLALTYLSATQFSVPGDETATFPVGIRVAATVSAGTIYGRVSTSSYGSSITTVTVAWDGTELDSGLSSIATGIITPASNALPYVNTLYQTPFDNTSASSDVPLGVGQKAYVTASGATSIPLHIACGDGQMYEIAMNGSHAQSAGGSISQLEPNNTTYSAEFYSRRVFGYGNGSGESPYGVAFDTLTNLSSFYLEGIGAPPMSAVIRAWTSTAAKHTQCEYQGWSTTHDSTGVVSGWWMNNTTPWTSLGTIVLPVAWTGIITIERKL